MRLRKRLVIVPALLISQAVCVMACHHACAITLPAIKDNTLFRYDPNDANTSFNSNGSGDFFAAGRTTARDEIRRGLIQFDLSSIPAGRQVVPGSVHLQLRVVDIPKKDTSPRPFWVVGLTGLGGAWGEGASTANIAVSGSGSGALAQANDATWLHTSYDPNLHDTTTFTPGGTGFWTQPGALGSAIADPAASYGPAAGMTASTQGFVDFHSASMENDLNAWLGDATKNFGWIIVGDEGVIGSDSSSKRGFASREHANPSFHPMLTFDIIPLPEPPAALLSTAAIMAAAIFSRHYRGITQRKNDRRAAV